MSCCILNEDIALPSRLNRNTANPTINIPKKCRFQYLIVLISTKIFVNTHANSKTTRSERYIHNLKPRIDPSSLEQMIQSNGARHTLYCTSTVKNPLTPNTKTNLVMFI